MDHDQRPPELSSVVVIHMRRKTLNNDNLSSPTDLSSALATCLFYRLPFDGETDPDEEWETADAVLNEGRMGAGVAVVEVQGHQPRMWVVGGHRGDGTECELFDDVVNFNKNIYFFLSLDFHDR